MGSSSRYKADESGKYVIRNETEGWKIKPKGLDIEWGIDSRYWRFNSDKEGSVELLQVCWLEVTGSLPLKDMERGKYNISFKVKMKEDAFGWSGCPIYLMAQVGKGSKYIWKSVDLNLNSQEKFVTLPENGIQIEVDRGYKKDDKLLFGMYEIWKGRWKGGLQIFEVIIEREREETDN